MPLPVSSESGAPKMGAIQQWLPSLALCVAIFLVAVYPALTDAWSFAPTHDTPHLTTPLFCEVGRHLRLGRIPLFDWTTFEPYSHLAHFVPIYPFYFTNILNYCDIRSGLAAHDLVVAFHLGLLCATSAVLARTAGLSPSATVFAAVAMAVSINAFVLGNWPTLIGAAAWLPLAVAGVVAVLHRGQWVGGVVMLSGGVGLMLLASPATNLIASLVAICLVISVNSAVTALVNGDWRRRFLPWILCAVVSGVMVALLAAGTTGNFLLALDDLIRWTRTGQVIGRNFDDTFSREILVEQQGVVGLLSVVLPVHIPFVAGSFFVGAVTLSLAVLGAWTARREALWRGFVLLTLISVFFVFLDPSGWVAGIWRRIPGLSHTRHLSLLAGPFVLATSLLAGKGLEALLRPEAERGRRLVAITLAGLAAIAVAGWIIGTGYAPLLIWPAVLAPVVVAALLIGMGHQLAAKRPAALAAALTIASGVAVVPQLHMRLVPASMSPSDTRGWNDLSRLVARVAATTSSPEVMAFHTSIASDDLNYISAGTAARLLGVTSFHYYLSPRVHWKFSAQNHQYPDFGFYARLGGRMLFAEGDLNDPRLELIDSEGRMRAYRIAGYRPLVVPICGAGPAPLGTGGGRPPRRGQLPEAPQPILLAARAADATPDACPSELVDRILIDRGRDALSFQLTPGSAQLLVINIPPYAAWRLVIGGEPVPIYTLDDNRVVAVARPGLSGHAEFAYRPVLYRVLLGVSVASAIGLGLVAFLARWFSRRRVRRVVNASVGTA